MKVRVDRRQCYGTGQCAEAAPDVFGQDPQEGLVVLIDDSPQEIHGEAVRFATQFCPSGSITIEGE